MVFSFKTVGKLQVIHQPLYRPKQIRGGEYAVGRKIRLERFKPRKKRRGNENYLLPTVDYRIHSVIQL
jgi:CRISPR/Cas system endoribonuclease Cas6 (RAMP superfamily)